MTVSSPTPPGFTLDSPCMAVMFISAHQVGMGSHTAEYVIGWKTVMGIIRDVFEHVSEMENIIVMLNQHLAEWAMQGWMGRGRHVNFKLKISEEEFFPPPKGQMKQIKLQFFDDLATSLRFFIRRKVALKPFLTLKQMTLQKLSLLVPSTEHLQSLELPRVLQLELKDEITSCWKHRYLIDLSNVDKVKKCFSEDFSDKKHAWRAKTFFANHKFNIEFK